nr:MAG TPA: hypothetical protein [Caudoviricetes sp.]
MSGLKFVFGYNGKQKPFIRFLLFSLPRNFFEKI